jgi:hypothetical protein
VNSLTEDNCDDIEDSFHAELACVFPKYHMKILLGDFNAKGGKISSDQ